MFEICIDSIMQTPFWYNVYKYNPNIKGSNKKKILVKHNEHLVLQVESNEYNPKSFFLPRLFNNSYDAMKSTLIERMNKFYVEEQ